MRVQLALAIMVAAAGCGGGGGSSPATPAAPALRLELLAGTLGPATSLDGQAGAATFGNPSGIAVAAAGTVYVSDPDNFNIRAIEPSGTVRTVAGIARVAGSTDGPATTATFTGPMGLALDPTGNLYVADGHRIRKLDAAGNVSTIAGGGAEGSEDGPGQLARFREPQGIAVDREGNIFVADWGNSTIRAISPDGTVRTIAGAAGQVGADDGSAATARFHRPKDIAIDPAGDLIISDPGNRRIRKLSRAGMVTTLYDGRGYYFFCPAGLAVDSAGWIFTSDRCNHVIHRTTPSGTSAPYGVVEEPGLVDGVGLESRFNGPRGLAIGPAGQLLVADAGNRRIRSVAAGIPVVTTIAGSDPFGAVDGVGALARFSRINDMAADGSGNLWVIERPNGSIRTVTALGRVQTVGNIVGVGWRLAGDSGANAIVASWTWCPGRFSPPGCIEGTDYFRVTAAGDISKLQHSFTSSPRGLARDGGGNLYSTTDSVHAIFKLTPALGSEVFAGDQVVPGYADGQRTQALFSTPGGLAFDGAGNLFVADVSNGALRRVSSTGEVTTVGRFPVPEAPFAKMPLAIDRAGNIYLADTDAHVVRKFTPNGAASIVAGVEGSPGFATGTLPARLLRPLGLAIIGNDLHIATEDAILVVRGIQ